MLGHENLNLSSRCPDIKDQVGGSQAQVHRGEPRTIVLGPKPLMPTPGTIKAKLEPLVLVPNALVLKLKSTKVVLDPNAWDLVQTLRHRSTKTVHRSLINGIILIKHFKKFNNFIFKKSYFFIIFERSRRTELGQGRRACDLPHRGDLGRGQG